MYQPLQKLLPEWYTWLTAVGCTLFLLGGLSLRGHGFFSAAGAMPWIGFIALAVWAFVSSALCVQKHANAHAMAPAMSH